MVDLYVQTAIDSNLLKGVQAIHRQFDQLAKSASSAGRAIRGTGGAGTGNVANEVKRANDALRRQRYEYRDLNREVRNHYNLLRSAARITTVPARQFSRGLVQSLGIGTLLGFGALVAGGLSTGYFSRGVISTGVEFDRMRASLRTLYKGNDAISRKKFAMISEYAKQTPFDLPDTFKGFIALKRIGIDPTAKRMKIMGNYAAAFGQSFEDMALAVEDAMMGQWRRMVQFGIRPEFLAKLNPSAFGGANGTKIVNPQGALNAMLQYMESNSAGMMDRMMNTFEGKWSNFKDALTRVFGHIFDAISPGLQALIKQATDLVELFGERLQSSGWLERMNQLFTSGEFLTGLRRTFITVTAGIIATAEMVKTELIPGFMQVAGVTRDIALNVGKFAKGVGNFGVKNPIGKGIFNAFIGNDKEASDTGIIMRNATIAALMAGTAWSGVKAGANVVQLAARNRWLIAAALASSAAVHMLKGSEHRAGGGPVNANRAYIVGENGPELYMPEASGRIFPNNASMWDRLPFPAKKLFKGRYASAARPRGSVGSSLIDYDEGLIRGGGRWGGTAFKTAEGKALSGTSIAELIGKDAASSLTGVESIASKPTKEAILKALRRQKLLYYRRQIASGGNNASGELEAYLEWNKALPKIIRKEAYRYIEDSVYLKGGSVHPLVAKGVNPFSRGLGQAGRFIRGGGGKFLEKLGPGNVSIGATILGALMEYVAGRKYEAGGNGRWLAAAGALDLGIGTVGTRAALMFATRALPILAGVASGPLGWIASLLLTAAAVTKPLLMGHIEAREAKKDAESLAFHKALANPAVQKKFMATIEARKRAQRAMLRKMGKSLPAIARSASVARIHDYTAGAPAETGNTWMQRYNYYTNMLNNLLPKPGQIPPIGAMADETPMDTMQSYGRGYNSGYGGLGTGWAGGGAILGRGLTLGDVLRGVNAVPVPVAVTVDPTGSGNVQSYVSTQIQAAISKALRATSVRLR